MKKNIIMFLLLSFGCQAAYPAQAEKNLSMGSLFSSFISFPPEPSLEQPLLAQANGSIQLREDRIHELREKLQHNFRTRNMLSYGSFALNAALVGVGLYQFGFFNLIRPAKSPAPVSAVNLAAQYAQLAERVKMLEDKVGITLKTTRTEWLISSLKSLSSYALLAIGMTKLINIKNYIEATPTIMYFLSKNNLQDRIEVLRKTVIAATGDMVPEEHSLDYYRRAINPMLLSIAIQLEKLVAFTDYYFSVQDDELVRKHALEDLSRQIFNISNNFLAKMHERLSTQNYHPEMVAFVDEFRNELNIAVKRCTFFEKEFVMVD